MKQLARRAKPRPVVAGMKKYAFVSADVFKLAKSDVCPATTGRGFASSRRGFTLRDVVVGMTAICVLLVLGVTRMLPTARVQTRRTNCQNCMHQLTTALAYFENQSGHYPGTANLLATNPSGSVTQTVGYVPLIFPALERNDLWRDWTTGNRTTPYIALLNCASNPPATMSGGNLAHVVNGGVADTTGMSEAEIRASGVSFDRTGTLHPPIEVGLAYLQKHDGAAHTLLMSENLQSGRWDLDNASDLKRQNAFVWHPDPAPIGARINQNKQLTTQQNSSLVYARPSSNHVGGVNAYFCDGHWEFIDETIDYGVWRQMMTSNDKL